MPLFKGQPNHPVNERYENYTFQRFHETGVCVLCGLPYDHKRDILRVGHIENHWEGLRLVQDAYPSHIQCCLSQLRDALHRGSKSQ